MQKINFFEFNKQTDLPEISAWKSRFGHTEAYQNITQFILNNENATLFKEINFDGALDKSGERRRKTFVAKNSEEEIVGFISIDEQSNDSAYIKFIVVNPKFAKKGYGTEILAKTLKNIRKIFNKPINKVYANIKLSNIASKKLFENVGFSRTDSAGSSKIVQYEINPEFLLSQQNQNQHS